MKRVAISTGLFLGFLLITLTLSNNFVIANEFDEVILREQAYEHLVDQSFVRGVSGKILLQVEENGEAWYVEPVSNKRFFLGRPGDAFQVMRDAGLGITNNDINKIPDATEVYSSQHDRVLANRLLGHILIQVEENGEAWYVNTITAKRHFLGRPADAFTVMRELGLGISNDDIRKVALGQVSDLNLEELPNAFFSVAEVFLANVSTIVSGNNITVISNGLPDHQTGQFPNSGNPNTISEQDIEKTFTLIPQKADVMTDSGGREFGIALNGILFEPLTGEYWNNDRTSGWNLEWSTNDLGFDFNNAHVQPDGTYHYHGSPTSLLNAINGKAQTLIGFAADGFPIYVENLESSYRLKSGIRSDGPGGSYDGTYVQDYEYVDGLGDLDECNGVYGTTPEYPEGTYYYVVSETFPIIGRCFWGTPDPSFSKGAGGGPPGGQGPGFPPPIF